MNNLDKAKELQARTKALAIRIIHFFSTLPKSDAARILGHQLIRTVPSISANYRAVCRSKSQADFISKMGTVVEETDETLFWFELFIEAGIVKKGQVQDMVAETTELLMIFSKSLTTAKNSSSSNR